MRLYPRKKRNGTTVWWASWTERKVTVRRSTRQHTRELAKLVVDRWARERADPDLEKARQARFGIEASNFLRERTAAKCAAGTVEMYEQKLANLCDVIGRDTPMISVDADRVASYFELRREEGAADTTLFKEWVALKGVLMSAWRRGRYNRDPRSVRPPWLSANYEPRKTFLSWEQADRLLEALRGDRRRTVAFVLATGARRAEWQNARSGDVDGTRVRMRGTKTDASATVIPIPKLMHRWLRLAGDPPFPPWTNARRDLIEAAERLDPPETREARRAGRDVSELPIFPRVTWNDLRRTFASLLVQAGVPPHLVAKLLRHKSTAMVDRVYGRQTDESLSELVDRALSGKPTVNQRRRTKTRPDQPGGT